MPKPQSLAERYGQLSLNAIMEIADDWERGFAVQGWVEAGAELEDDTVLVKTSDGKELRADYKIEGKYVSIGANGRRLKRKHAAYLLSKYGQAGQYRGVDQATGFSPVQWARYKSGPDKDVAASLAEQMAAEGIWVKGQPNFISNYLLVDEPQAEPAKEPAEE